MMGVRRVGEEGLLLCSVVVRVGGAGAVYTEAATHERRSTKSIASPAQAV